MELGHFRFANLNHDNYVDMRFDCFSLVIDLEIGIGSRY